MVRMRQYLLVTFLMLCIDSIAQNNFAPKGTFWNYSYQPHVENGEGWETLTIGGDTIINAKVHQHLISNFFYKQTFPPFDSSRYSTTYLINFTNDSLIINNQLNFDYNASINDTMRVYSFMSGTELLLTVDSISYEVIEGISHKKWYGQKLCPLTNNESFGMYTWIENIGPIGDEYLLWNAENCFTGGGTKNFYCYSNQEITYPEDESCTPKVLNNTRELLAANQLFLSPNPVKDFLFVVSKENIVGYQVYDSYGRIVELKSNIMVDNSIDVSNLLTGLYIVIFDFADSQVAYNFVKL